MSHNVNLYDDTEEEKKHSDDNGINGASLSQIDSQSTTTSAYQVQAKQFSSSAAKIGDSSWRQLRCKMQTMTYSLNWVVCIYLIIAVIFIPIGVLTFNLSRSVTVQEFPEYHSLSDCSVGTNGYGAECKVNYTLDYDFNPPIYFHYKLTKFYQNHRSYVKSLSRDQLLNEDRTENKYCEPSDTQTSQAPDPYADLIVLPCGLIANSFFNDKFKVRYFPNDDSGDVVEFCNTTQCEMDEQGIGIEWSNASWYASPNWERDDIAWTTDVDGRYEATEQIEDTTTDVNELQYNQNVTLPQTDDPDFIVWMRTATIPTFSKLYRIINGQKLEKGSTIEVTIKNYFKVDDFSGSKRLLISTNSSLGGKNNALGIAFMAIGGVSFLTAIFFKLVLPSQRNSLAP